MKILITGGNGFIAKNLYESLKEKYNITILNKYQLNLLDSNLVEDHILNNKYDIIIHTSTYDAAPKHSNKDPNKVLEYNLKMFFNIIRCLRYFDKLIYFGSGAEFSRENWNSELTEDDFDKAIPADQYGFSKYIMCKYTSLEKKIYNLRLFSVFGKYEDWRTRFISNICCQIIHDLPVVVKNNFNYDFLYIDDLIKITEYFIENNPTYNIYNVCSGKVYNSVSIAKKLIEISKKNLEIKLINESPIYYYGGSNKRLINEIKYLELTNFDLALENLYNWYLENKNLIDKNLVIESIK